MKIFEITKKELLNEKWSEKYKKSIDCNNPKGFSQKAHCKGKLKEEEGYNIDTRKIYVLVGPPSVGKSTWIKNTFSDIQPYVISRDDIVEQIADNLGWTYDDLFVAPPQGSQLGDYDEKYGEVIKSPSYMSWQPLSFSKVLEANNQVQVLFTKRVSNAVNSEKDIVVDMTNMTAGSRKNALKAIQGSENLFEKIAVIFPFEGAEDVIIDVARKRAEAAKRMGKSKTLPDSVMRKMFASFQNVSPDEGFDKVIQQDNRELLSTLNEEDEYLLEPKRPKPKTTLELGISTEEGKGVDNIIAVYNDADDEEKDYWGKWYYHANKDVTTLSNKYGIDFRIAAAVIAVLSPGNKWLGNLYAAEKTIQKFNDPSVNISISAYGKNVIKALKILETGDVGYVTGPKVSVFFLSLVDPQSVNKELVLDSHAINIWFGIKRNLKQTPTISNKLRNQVLEDYKKAAQILGVSLQSLQAVTWYVWKYTKKPPVIKHTDIKVRKSSKKISELKEEGIILNEYSEKFVNNLINKFKQEKPNLSTTIINAYVNRFIQIKDNPKIIQKDITKYTWKELETIIDTNQPKSIKSGKINDGNPNDGNLVYNQNGLRIYIGKTRNACIKYGNGYSFCISARGRDTMYYDYRYEENGSPYFVFDDTKSSKQDNQGNFIEPEHLLVIFKYGDDDDEYQEYTVTNANNDGDKRFYNFVELQKSYSRLKGLIEIFKKINHDPKEKNIYDIEIKYGAFLEKSKYSELFYKYFNNNIKNVDKYLDDLISQKIDIYELIATPKYTNKHDGPIKQNVFITPKTTIEKAIDSFKENLRLPEMNPNSDVSDYWDITYQKAFIQNWYKELLKLKEIIDNYRNELSKANLLNEKTDFSKEKEQGLHGWFARQGGKGKSKGWVDCNTCRDGKCKSCGRKEGEKRSKYPACRPTPSACKTKGKGKSWGKKSANEDVSYEQSKQDIERELKLNEIKNTFKRLLK
jgi:hypothetical protein